MRLFKLPTRWRNNLAYRENEIRNRKNRLSHLINQEIWSTTEASCTSYAPYLRLQMAANLVNNNTLLGRTEVGIKQMLDNPQENTLSH